MKNYYPVAVRSEHLEAIIQYVLEQAVTSGGEINPLDVSDSEVVSVLQAMLDDVQAVRGDHHQDIYLIDCLLNSDLYELHNEE